LEQEKVGRLISKLRKESNLTQTELGEKIGVSPKTISKWECGNGLPDITFLKKISDIFGITIEELLDGTTKEKTIPNKNYQKTIIIIIIIIIIITTIITIIITNKKQTSQKENNNCIVIRTYYIDNIGKSNDENYLYITIHEYQVEGTYTLKLPKLISKDLKVGNSYEFTFKTSKNYLKTTTDNLFNNSTVINLEYTEKEGNERISKYECH